MEITSAVKHFLQMKSNTETQYVKPTQRNEMFNIGAVGRTCNVAFPSDSEIPLDNIESSMAQSTEIMEVLECSRQ